MKIQGQKSYLFQGCLVCTAFCQADDPQIMNIFRDIFGYVLLERFRPFVLCFSLSISVLPQPQQLPPAQKSTAPRALLLSAAITLHQPGFCQHQRLAHQHSQLAHQHSSPNQLEHQGENACFYWAWKYSAQELSYCLDQRDADYLISFFTHLSSSPNTEVQLVCLSSS